MNASRLHRPQFRIIQLISRKSRRRAAEATAVIPATPSGIFAVEGFIDCLGFVSPAERLRMKLAASEIFDNLVHHAAPLDSGSMTLRAARRGPSLTLAFYFKAEAFAAYTAACPDTHEPLFDRHHRRWRGIGLRMCRNLTTAIRFRAGEKVDRIYLDFGAINE